MSDDWYIPETPKTETRSGNLAVEFRSAKGGKTIGGLAAVYGKKSQPLNGFREVVEKSAFQKTLGDNANVMCRFEHDPRMLLGTTRSGSLRLTDTPVGLDYEVDVPMARDDVLELAQRGELRSSFAFLAYQDDVSFEGQIAIRHLVSVKLIDCAPTSNPVYLETDCGLRSFAERYGAPIEEVRGLASRNELYRLSDQADRSYIDLAPPTPLTVAQRSAGGSVDLARRRLESSAKKIAMDTGRRPDQKPELSIEQRLLKLRRAKSQWDAPVEARSYPVGTFGDLDRFGNPARRNSNGHAID